MVRSHPASGRGHGVPRGSGGPAFGVLLSLMGVLLPQAAIAQVCLGVPAGPGQFALGGAVAFADNATGFEAHARTNLDGPVSLGGVIGIVDVDDVDSNIVTGSGSLSFELPTQGFSACPTVGAGYARWSETVEGLTLTLSELRFPLGLSVGVQLGEEGSALLLPTVGAGFFYSRQRGSLENGDTSLTATESETEVFVNGGATLAFGALFLRGSVSKTTIDDSAATIRLGLGLVF